MTHHFFDDPKRYFKSRKGPSMRRGRIHHRQSGMSLGYVPFEDLNQAKTVPFNSKGVSVSGKVFFNMGFSAFVVEKKVQLRH